MPIQEIYVTSKSRAVQATVYRIEPATEQDAERLRQELLTDPITEFSTLNQRQETGGVEVGYKPGVMDPVEASVIKAARGLGIEIKAVSTSTLYLDEDAPFISQLQQIIDKKPDTLLIDTPPKPVEIIPIRDLTTEELGKLSKERSLFLDLSEMKEIQKFAQNIGRELTDVEIETFAQTWSEHNKHKTFNAILVDEDGNRYPSLMKMIKGTSEKYFDEVGVVSAFADNAGGILFYEADGEMYVIVIKGETHNSPVAVEPYGGSLTKNGGVYRDIAGFGQGGKNLAGFMVNCFADPLTPKSDIPEGVLPPKHLLLENSRGERDYGNRMGIPTHNISLHFHPDFGPKPTSLGIVVGILPEKYAHKEIPQPGDLVISVGGKTGKDGIHGATFSSGAMTNKTSTVHATAVQIGNSIEQKRMFDALIACRDKNLIRTITDCGGGGYSSAIGEIAAEVGVEINLDEVLLKYQGLSPWEIWLSESQERMIAVINPNNWEEFKKICDGFNAPATVIGVFTGDKILTLRYEEEIVGQIPMDFLHHGLPVREMLIRRPKRIEEREFLPCPQDFADEYQKVLMCRNVASVESMLRMYDQTVQGRSALAPFTGVYEDCPSDASVIAPLRGESYGVVTAHATNPLLNRLDPYWGSVWAGTHALSKFVAVGGDIRKAAINDNFVSPVPDPEVLWDLRESTQALCDMMDATKIPCISGKDSLSSTYVDKEEIVTKIPPVLNITVFGKIPDVLKSVSSDFKEVGSALILVGKQDLERMGGSIYFQNHYCNDTHVPQVDLELLPKTLSTMHKAIESGKVKACKTVGEGGMAVALAQMCFGGDCGAEVDLTALGKDRPDHTFFNETPGVFIVEVENDEIAGELFAGIPHQIFGLTTKEKTICVRSGENQICAADIYELKNAWQKPMQEILDAN
jgi:phosphoribosylformylglycinamidine synthase